MKTAPSLPSRFSPSRDEATDDEADGQGGERRHERLLPSKAHEAIIGAADLPANLAESVLHAHYRFPTLRGAHLVHLRRLLMVERRGASRRDVVQRCTVGALRMPRAMLALRSRRRATA